MTGWRVLLNYFFEFVSLPANKLIDCVFANSLMNGEFYEQNEFVSSTTNYNNYNKTTTLLQLVEKLFVSQPTNKLGRLVALLALFCNEELQLLRHKESVARLLFLLLEKHAVFLNTSEIRTYYKQRIKSNKPSWWTLYNQDADDLITLGFAEKRFLHPDAENQPMGPGRKPMILCLKECPDAVWRAVSLDAVNWRQSQGDRSDEWLEGSEPTALDVDLLLLGSKPIESEEDGRAWLGKCPYYPDRLGEAPKPVREKALAILERYPQIINPEASPAASRKAGVDQ